MENNIYSGEERRRRHILPEELIEEIVERASDRAAEKALNKMESTLYQAVGKTFINKFLQLIGAVIIGLGVYLNHKGFFKL